MVCFSLGVVGVCVVYHRLCVNLCVCVVGGWAGAVTGFVYCLINGFNGSR